MIKNSQIHEKKLKTFSSSVATTYKLSPRYQRLFDQYCLFGLLSTLNRTIIEKMTPKLIPEDQADPSVSSINKQILEMKKKIQLSGKFTKCVLITYN